MDTKTTIEQENEMLLRAQEEGRKRIGYEEKKPIKRVNIDAAMEELDKTGSFATFLRYPEREYDMNNALELVTRIGKKRSPRFVIDDDNRLAYENFIKWLHCDESMMSIDPITNKLVKGNLKGGIYIAGGTGAGKSWCLEIMLSYARIWNFKVQFPLDANPRPLQWEIHRADDIAIQFARVGEVMRFRGLETLGIQDLGQEPKEAMYMGNRLNVLQQVLECRGDNKSLVTLITSNYAMGGKALQEAYGDRVRSRLIESCNYLVIKGKDRRELK